MGVLSLPSDRGIQLQKENTAPWKVFCNVCEVPWHFGQAHFNVLQQSNIAELLNIFSEFSVSLRCCLPPVFLISLDKECKLLFPYMCFLLGTRGMKWSFRSLKYVFKKYIGVFFISRFFSHRAQKKPQNKHIHAKSILTGLSNCAVGY